MFSSQNHLKRRTPCRGIDREEFIEHLVQEFYSTNNLEAQEQVTANLANFAYDPVNWDYIKAADALQLYLELLEKPSEILQQNGTAGLCNICLDEDAFKFITKPENLKLLHHLLLKTDNKEVILNCCTIIYHLISFSNKQKPDILTGEILKRIQHFSTYHKSDKRVYILCSLLLDDFGKRQQELKFVKKFSQQDLDKFSQLTGDFNDIHSQKYSERDRVVHGAFLNAVVAGLIGTHFPGSGTIVLEQKFTFPKPCRINLDCQFVIRMKQRRKISMVSYECVQNSTIVFEGEAKLLISNKDETNP